MMKSVVNGMNALACASRLFLAASVVFAGCDSGDDGALESEDDDRGATQSIMHCKTAAGVGDGKTKFVYETADFVGTDAMVPVHVTRERPGGVDDYGWIQTLVGEENFSFSAPNKLTMTVYNKANDQASIEVKHAVNGAGKPGIVAKASNGFCTFKKPKQCGEYQKLACNWGACTCQNVGEAGGWYTSSFTGGSVTFALTGMVLADGPFPVGDTAALVSLFGIGVLYVVANNKDLLLQWASSIGGKVELAFNAPLASRMSDELEKELGEVSNQSDQCLECVKLCIIQSGFGGAHWGNGGKYCEAYECSSDC